jgi:hypothetical protein
VRRHQKLKDIIAQLQELGMPASPEIDRPRARGSPDDIPPSSALKADSV